MADHKYDQGSVSPFKDPNDSVTLSISETLSPGKQSFDQCKTCTVLKIELRSKSHHYINERAIYE
jgi:hypothetical protein